MGDDDDGDAVLRVELLEHAQHFLARARVQVAGRLVGEDQRRMVDQRARDGHALLLAAGELGGLVVHAVLQADPAQHLPGLLQGLAIGKMAGRVRERHRHVFQGARARQQVEILEDEAELVVAHQGALVVGQRRHILTVEPVFARRRAVQAAQDVHQRALARSGGPHQRDQFPAGDRHRDPLEHGDIHVPQLVRFVDVAQLDEFHGPTGAARRRQFRRRARSWVQRDCWCRFWRRPAAAHRSPPSVRRPVVRRQPRSGCRRSAPPAPPGAEHYRPRAARARRGLRARRGRRPHRRRAAGPSFALPSPERDDASRNSGAT